MIKDTDKSTNNKAYIWSNIPVKRSGKNQIAQVKIKKTLAFSRFILDLSWGKSWYLISFFLANGMSIISIITIKGYMITNISQSIFGRKLIISRKRKILPINTGILKLTKYLHFSFFPRFIPLFTNRINSPLLLNENNRKDVNIMPNKLISRKKL